MPRKHGGARPGAGRKRKEQPIAGPLDVFSCRGTGDVTTGDEVGTTPPVVNNDGASADPNPYIAANQERRRQEIQNQQAEAVRTRQVEARAFQILQEDEQRQRANLRAQEFAEERAIEALGLLAFATEPTGTGAPDDDGKLNETDEEEYIYASDDEGKQGNTARPKRKHSYKPAPDSLLFHHLEQFKQRVLGLGRKELIEGRH